VSPATSQQDGPDGFRGRVEGAADAVVPRRLRAYHEQILYLGVGGWNTLFGYLNFALLYYLLSDRTSVVVILLVSYALSITNAYVCYRYIVFRSTGSLRREIPRFTSVYLVALAANLVVLPLALRLLPVNAYVVQALFTAVVVVVSYLGHKHFSFRGGQGNAAASETSPESRDPGGA
jgi:putative flippase GtrA